MVILKEREREKCLLRVRSVKSIRKVSGVFILSVDMKLPEILLVHKTYQKSFNYPTRTWYLCAPGTHLGSDAGTAETVSCGVSAALSAQFGKLGRKPLGDILQHIIALLTLD